MLVSKKKITIHFITILIIFLGGLLLANKSYANLLGKSNRFLVGVNDRVIENFFNDKKFLYLQKKKRPVIPRSLSSRSSMVNIMPVSVGAPRLAVFLYDFQNSPVDGSGNPIRPFTKEQVRETLFRGDVSQFFREISYGKIQALDGEVFDWERLPRSVAHDDSCYYPTDQELEQSINRKNIDISAFHILVVVARDGSTNAINDCFNSWRGYSGDNAPPPPHERIVALNYRGRQYFIVGVFVPRISEDIYAIIHELGHAFGEVGGVADHPQVLDCEIGSVFEKNCILSSSFNYYDFLASPPNFIFNANPFYKERLGWLDPSSLLTINSTGTFLYELAPYAVKPSNNSVGKIAAKIILPGQTEPIYYLTYQQPIGIDWHFISPVFPFRDNYNNLRDISGNIGGLFLYRKHISEESGVIYPLLDLSPTASPVQENSSRTEKGLARVDFDQVALTKKGNSSSVLILRDNNFNISIGPILQATPDKVVFVVTIGSTTLEKAPLVSAGEPHYFDFSALHEHQGGIAYDVNGNLDSYYWELSCNIKPCPLLSSASGTISGDYALIPPPKFRPLNENDVYTLKLIVKDKIGLTSSAEIKEMFFSIKQPVFEPRESFFEKRAIIIDTESNSPLGISEMSYSFYSGYLSDLILNPFQTKHLCQFVPAQTTVRCRTSPSVYDIGSTYFYIEAKDVDSRVIRQPNFTGFHKFMVYRDTAPPVIRVNNFIYKENDEPIDISKPISSEQKIFFQVVAEDTGKIEKIAIFVDDNKIKECSFMNELMVSSSVICKSEPALYSIGRHVFSFEVTDAASNTSRYPTKPNQINSFLVVEEDRTPPRISILSPQNGAFVSGTIAIRADIDDNVSANTNNLAEVSLLIDGVLWEDFDLLSNSSKEYSSSLNTFDLQNGWHTLVVKAVDKSNNIASATVNFYITNQLPARNFLVVQIVRVDKNGFLLSKDHRTFGWITNNNPSAFNPALFYINALQQQNEIIKAFTTYLPNVPVRAGICIYRYRERECNIPLTATSLIPIGPFVPINCSINKQFCEYPLPFALRSGNITRVVKIVFQYDLATSSAHSSQWNLWQTINKQSLLGFVLKLLSIARSHYKKFEELLQY